MKKLYGAGKVLKLAAGEHPSTGPLSSDTVYHLMQ
tara:strand:- start:18 stop:122 length:105 start_codon:yes stop_codon:yes gene_type:complete